MCKQLQYIFRDFDFHILFTHRHLIQEQRVVITKYIANKKEIYTVKTKDWQRAQQQKRVSLNWIQAHYIRLKLIIALCLISVISKNTWFLFKRRGFYLNIRNHQFHIIIFRNIIQLIHGRISARILNSLEPFFYKQSIVLTTRTCLIK